MSQTVVIGSSDQVVAYAIRSMVGEVENFKVVDVADTSTRLEEIAIRREPDVILVYADLGPTPVLQTVRDIVIRRPECAVVVLADEVTPAVLTQAMDAGARGVLEYPLVLEDLTSRLALAAQWSTQMRRHVAASSSETGHEAGRGRLVVVTGSKGGVGTSTLATHLAHSYVRNVPGKSVCLVDLDLEKGDLAHFLGVTHRLDIADLAKVATDLGPQTVNSAVHRDGSGVGLLLAPSNIEEVGDVGDRETRLILAAVRRQFDLVIVDAGSHVNPVSAAAVEIADEVALVATPEVLALRGVHRTLEAWGRVGARKPDAVTLVLNRVSKVSDIQPDSAARLVPLPISPATLPAAFKRLEPGINYRNPAEVKDRAWWSAIERLAGELSIIGAPTTRQSRSRKTPKAPRTHGRRRQVALNEQGQAALEFTGMLPLLIFLVVVVWQVALWGATVAVSGHAADEAARASAIGNDPTSAATESLPGWLSGGFSVVEGPASVRVTSEVPLLVPGVSSSAWTFSTTVGVVDEPS